MQSLDHLKLLNFYFHRSKKSSVSYLLVCAVQGNFWRFRHRDFIIKTLTNFEKVKSIQENARRNLLDWEKHKNICPMKVEVINEDWGVACLDATSKYGGPYAVLNMASSYYPGGAFLDLGSAQEENMWQRSTCALSLFEPGILWNEKDKCFKYDFGMTNLLNAQQIITERHKLLVKREDGSYHHRVYFGKEMRSCFVGPEIYEDVSNGGTGDNRYSRVPDSALSFQSLPDQFIFPFFELRSAAPELPELTMSNLEDNNERYVLDIRRRIAAQLDTLIVNNQMKVILGAWGCGAFQNSPSVVARIYQEEILKRAHCFQHIVFSVLSCSPKESRSFNLFKECLQDLPLQPRVRICSE
jgi:hypothetical protein